MPDEANCTEIVTFHKTHKPGLNNETEIVNNEAENVNIETEQNYRSAVHTLKQCKELDTIECTGRVTNKQYFIPFNIVVTLKSLTSSLHA